MVPKGSSLLLEDDEVPNSQERVLGNAEVEELSTGKGAERAELAGRAGGVVSQEKASWEAERGRACPLGGRYSIR